MLSIFQHHARKYLPQPLLDTLRKIRFFLRKINSFGLRHYCPICQSRVRKWQVVHYQNSTNLECPVCFSSERHRLDWLFLVQRTNLLSLCSQSFLHIAPEPFFISRLKKVPGIQYMTADLNHRLAMVWLDLVAIPVFAGYFDAIYCSHVLEHIQDDKKALSELFRVLKPGGWAILQVPITAEKTFENPSIVDPIQREKLFGQRDHVRRCGWDYVDRMCTTGFNAKIVPAGEIITTQEGLYMGIQMTRVVIWCEKVCE